MTFKKSLLILSGVLTVSACANTDLNGAQFWQRKNISEAIYARGTDAQTQLNRDISQCVVDIRETSRMDSLRNTIPPDKSTQGMTPDEKKMADWESPDHDGALLAEHSDYHDFETCMGDKGWERVDDVPFTVAKEARTNYFGANAKYDHTDPATERNKPYSPATGADSKLNN